MTRDQFEHAVRAAGAIVGTGEILIIGSQALCASVTSGFPKGAQRSVEVDVAVLGDEDGSLADLIDGSIGEAPMFHETFGYYAQGVSETTAVLASGWRDRLIRFETPGTQGIVAACLEPHDLWIAKAIANRDKDLDFCRELLEAEIVDRSALHERLDAVENLDEQLVSIIRQRIEA